MPLLTARPALAAAARPAPPPRAGARAPGRLAASVPPRAASVDEAVTAPEAGVEVEYPPPAPAYVKPTPGAAAATKFRLAFALPWRRFKRDSVLVVPLAGSIGDKRGGRFSSAATLPQITRALEKAAYDPRVAAVYLKIDPLAAGWAKLGEIRDYVKLFKASGKPVIAFLERGGEKEYYVASAASKIYMPDSAALSLRGIAVSGTFLRGVFEKVGVRPEIVRIGAYKSAGDQLLRKDMAPEQREALTAILDAVFDTFVSTVAADRGLTKDDVTAFLDRGVYDAAEFVAAGIVDGLKYEDEVVEELRVLTGLDPAPPADGAALTFPRPRDAKPPKPPAPLRTVGLKKYAFVSPTAFGLAGRDRIAVVRINGAIVGGASPSDAQITAGPFVKQLNALADTPKIKAVVLVVNSPGGDALASDLAWRAVKRCAARKPVVAAMTDVAASGGYYISMAATKIVAAPLTLTGSIGVVAGKVSLDSLYDKVGGYAKTNISRGRYAELLADNRPFSDDEAALFDRAVAHSYASFRDKAAASRGMSVDAMQAVAQGRVWVGADAVERGLVDALGGVATAVALAARLAGVPDGERVAQLELSRSRANPVTMLLGGGGAVARAAAAAASALAQGGPDAAARAVGAAALVLTTAAAGDAGVVSGAAQYVAPDVEVVGASELGV